MYAGALICTIFAAGAAPVPPVPANQAPPPRRVKPDVSLIVVDVDKGSGKENPPRGRVHLVGFRNGKQILRETAWEGNETFLDRNAPFDFTVPDGWQALVAGRYLVTGEGGVIDLHAKKVLNTEERGEELWYDETKVTYSVKEPNRVQGRFTFEYATGTLTRIGAPFSKTEWFENLSVPALLSPDCEKAIKWRGESELILHQRGQKPTSLGKGFTMEADRELLRIRSEFMCLPLLWLDNATFLTQRGNGKLVAVDLVGKVTDIATIKNVPDCTWPELFRDRSGAVIYVMGSNRYKIDVTKKTAKQSEWEGLGNGFEVSWSGDEKLGLKLRYKGKDIGQFRCDPETAQTAPGYLAICKVGAPQFLVRPQRGDIVVWSAATEEWTKVSTKWKGRTPIVGWIK